MGMSRQIYQFDAGDSGSRTDTGPAFWGEVAQLHWNPVQADTGADLVLTLIPKLGDTGDGFDVYNETDALSANLTRVPRQAGHDINGTDTGVDAYFPIVAAGDHLRAKLVPGDTGSVQGTLYVWIKD